MAALDTNVLVRYLAQDDVRQSARATRLLERELTATDRGFVSLVALLETVWVMESRYGAKAHLVGDILTDMLDTPTLEIQESAADLAHVNELLEQEIGERADVERELATTKAALAKAQAK